MGLFDRFQKKALPLTLEELKQVKYRQKYAPQCRYIWANYVPPAGQADVLQGELLRRLEKLRREAQENGNINWDEEFSRYCDFLQEHLCRLLFYDADQKKRIALILDYFRACGDYAWHWYGGDIADAEMDPARVAYTDDNLYDILADCIGQVQAQHPQPMPYQRDKTILR